MDTGIISTILILILTGVMIYGLVRDLLKAREQGLSELSALRLDKLKCDLQLESAKLEIIRLEKELAYWKYEIRGAQGIGVNISDSQVDVGRDLGGRDIQK